MSINNIWEAHNKKDVSFSVAYSKTAESHPLNGPGASIIFSMLSKVYFMTFLGRTEATLLGRGILYTCIMSPGALMYAIVGNLNCYCCALL